MRQNESVLNHKENELKNLLEELYLHEIYLDSVNNETQQQQQQQQKLSYVQKTATLTATQAAKNSKLKTLAQSTELLSSSITSSTTSSASLTPPINENDVFIDNDEFISSLYETTPIPESQLPPIHYVKKGEKRLKSDSISSN